ncbi:MAG: cation-transporting P-type ATPase [Aquisalimonadaceae bacterium]
MSAFDEQQEPATMAQDNRPLWHVLPSDDVLRRLQTGSDGLTPEQVRERIRQYGANRLKPPARRGLLMRFLLQFNNVLIYVLLAAAGVTAMLQHWVDTGVILGVVVINALIGVIQEGKAEKALDAIRDMLSPRAMVIRNGRRQEVPAAELVPGDIVILQSGDRVAADLRLLRVRDLRIDESMLTGESLPADKSVELMAENAMLGDRLNLAYSGTLVNYGHGTGVVVATGDATEIGRISAMLAEVEDMTTPLLRKIDVFGRWLAAAILLLAAATFLFGLGFRDYAVAEIFLAAVGLAVAAIPEGLPAIMTITLAIGVQRMASRHAIIRRLPAVETLGSVTVICSDKTGTLTRNEMTVRSVETGAGRYTVSGVGYGPEGALEKDGRPVSLDHEPQLEMLCRAALLCNDAALEHADGQWRLHGDPTEGALVTLAMKADMEPALVAREYPRTDAIPFESEHQFMATLHHDHISGATTVYVKGAPERVLTMSDRQQGPTGDVPLDQKYWHGVMEDLADRGHRVLALAMRQLPQGQENLAFADVEQGLVLLGMVGIIDPPRDEAISAVADCRKAGIRVKMITGDHALTARAIGRELGIGDGLTALTGKEVEELDDQALRRVVAETDVFARASPEHKLRLVQALQANGEVVAMTGDGVNDAPALKRADVGVAMGLKGTEVSREASEMVLADDNFASIVKAVEEGRTVYDNLRKALLFLLPTNGGQALVIICAVLGGIIMPITPVQILWVNMVTAVTLGLALAFEPPEPGVMQRPPRPPKEQILSGFLVWRVSFVSLLLVLATFGMFIWSQASGDSIETARTVAVNTLVVCQAFYLLSARYVYAPAWTGGMLSGNRWIPGSIAAIVVLQLLFTYAPPLRLLFGTQPLPVTAWLWMPGAGLLVFICVEVEKRIMGRSRRAPVSVSTE